MLSTFFHAPPWRKERCDVLRDVGASRSQLQWLFIWFLLITNCLGAEPLRSGVEPNVISLPSGAGSIEGLGTSYEVQLNSGSASYGVDIELPPGRAGFAPQLALAYNSNLGNSIVGIGWSLSFPEISRFVERGFPEYGDSDVFVFGGEELVPLTNPEKDWRCENESAFKRFRQIDSDDDLEMDGWEVTDRNGVKHLLGTVRGENDRWSAVENATTGSQATDFDRTFIWAVNQSTDLHGNRIDYEYTLDGGTLYPHRITYAHKGANYYEVRFLYETRPDQLTDYRAGFARSINQRLVEVVVNAVFDGSTHRVRRYQLNYVNSSGAANQFLDNGVSRLVSVTQHDASEGDANYLPPIRFEYTSRRWDAISLKTLQLDSGIGMANSAGRVQLADVNGDSLPDILESRSVGAVLTQRVALNQGESNAEVGVQLKFAPPVLIDDSSEIDLGRANTGLMDYDADGLIDVINVRSTLTGGEIDIYRNRARSPLSSKVGFESKAVETIRTQTSSSLLSLNDPGVRLIDLNFDKASDFLSIRSGSIQPEIYGLFRTREGAWEQKRFPPPSDLPNTVTFSAGGASNPAVKLADMNGDRLLDLVWLKTEGSGIATTLKVLYWPMIGLGQWGPQQTLSNAAGDTFQIGATDLRDIYVQDLTGDGLADILVVTGGAQSSSIQLRTNLYGKSWSSLLTRGALPRYQPRDSSNPTGFLIADINGNGTDDLIWENRGLAGGWNWLELVSTGKSGLLSMIDNGLGKRTYITYGSSTEDLIRARVNGAPWKTNSPVPVQVVRQIRHACPIDLDNLPDATNGGSTDQYVIGFQYRDPFYDAWEREFRGFAFAQQIEYGDDFVYDAESDRMTPSAGWNRSKSPTGQVSAPSLVSRFRFHTGAPDGRNNDVDGPSGFVDEITPKGGREEEVLKGRILLEEQIDPWALFDPGGAGDFDAGALAVANATRTGITPDTYVYLRKSNKWEVRRLYRESSAMDFVVDQNGDGVLEKKSQILIPSGRFAAANPSIRVTSGDGRTVSFAFVSEIRQEVIEANGTLSQALGYPARAAKTIVTSFDRDDYGNPILEYQQGADGGALDDERKVTTTYAHMGKALEKWIVDKPSSVAVTDEDGKFVSEKRMYYDGVPFEGLALGYLGDRALLHREAAVVTGSEAIPEISEISEIPGDPRLLPGYSISQNRTRYDVGGNPVEIRDPLATGDNGHTQHAEYDETFGVYPISERFETGDVPASLEVEADYNFRFGVIESYTDFNGNSTTFQYDSFARLTSIVRPYDSPEYPTSVFDYRMVDPFRSETYSYSAAGALTLTSGQNERVSRVATSLREKSGTNRVYTSLGLVDGFGRQLAQVSEDVKSGDWIVSQAQSFNRRMEVRARWMPYSFTALVATSPRFTELWSGNRPLAKDLLDRQVHGAEVLYDPLGRVIVEIQPPEKFEDASRGKVITQRLPLEERVFDENDSDPASPFVSTPTVKIFDGLERLVELHEVVRLDDDGSAAEDINIWVTHYSYDLGDRLVSILDSQNNLKWMRHDGLGRMIFMHDPNRGVIERSYDDASNLVRRVDAKGQVTTFTYDGLNRIKTEDYHDGGGFDYNADEPLGAENRADVVYFYDSGVTSLEFGDGTLRTAGNTKGQVAYVWDLSGEEHLSYDARGRIQWKVKRIIDPETGNLVSFPSQYEYDAADRIQRLHFPDADYVDYVYNDRNLLDSIVGGPNGKVISGISYTPSSQQRSVTYGNGFSTARVYDPRLRLRELTTFASGQKSAPRIDYAYSFDKASHITRIDDRRPASVVASGSAMRNTQIFGYDDLNRLTQVRYSFSAPDGEDDLVGQISYRYDRIGNMVSKTSDLSASANMAQDVHLGAMFYGGTAGSRNRVGRTEPVAGPHALTMIGAEDSGRSLEYDDNGNLVDFDGMQSRWDFKDRLIGLENAKMHAEYVYDYLDRRVVKSVHPKNGSSASTVLYPDRTFETREFNAPVKYVWSGDERIASVTGNLNGSRRVQRVRLAQGWNLLALGVEINEIASLFVDGVDEIFRIDPDSDLLVAMDFKDVLEVGSLLWVHSRDAQVLSIDGIYRGEVESGVADLRGFWGNGAFSPYAIGPPEIANGAVWFFDNSNQNWTPAINENFGFWREQMSVYLSGGGGFQILSTAHEIEPLRLRSDISYYHKDHLGSSCLVTNSRGMVVDEVNFLPYGDIRHSDVSGFIRQEYQFTQKERDKESKLNYFESRYQLASIASFIRVDVAASQKLLKSEVVSCP
jgi:YD repeat-containing protein